jgi:4-oxalocrotonate tautomerase
VPLFTIQLLEGHSAQQKEALLKNASQAVVDSIGAPLASVRGILVEVAAQHAIVAGEIGHPMARVDVALIVGRTPEQKEALIAAIDLAVRQSLNLTPQDVRVILGDVPNADMGLAGGKTARASGR